MHEDPPRLVDDLELNGTLRNDVQHASAQHHAYAAAYDTTGKLAAFQAVLAAGATPAAAAPIGASIAKGVIGIVGAVALVAVGMATGAALHARWQATPRTSAPAVSQTPTTPAALPTVATPSAAPVGIDAVTVRQQAPSTPTTLPPSRHGELDATRQERQELQQLARIRARLQAKHPDQALQLAERAQRELGESALWQEREGLAVLALFALEQTAEAERRARALLDRFPDSPFRAELEQHLRQAHAP